MVSLLPALPRSALIYLCRGLQMVTSYRELRLPNGPLQMGLWADGITRGSWMSLTTPCTTRLAAYKSLQQGIYFCWPSQNAQQLCRTAHP